MEKACSRQRKVAFIVSRLKWSHTLNRIQLTYYWHSCLFVLTFVLGNVHVWHLSFSRRARTYHSAASEVDDSRVEEDGGHSQGGKHNHQPEHLVVGCHDGQLDQRGQILKNYIANSRFPKRSHKWPHPSLQADHIHRKCKKGRKETAQKWAMGGECFSQRLSEGNSPIVEMKRRIISGKYWSHGWEGELIMVASKLPVCVWLQHVVNDLSE